MKQVKKLFIGQSVTDGYGLANPALVQTTDRIVEAIQDIQEGPILTSPDGTEYRITVDNAGNLSTVAV